TRGFCRTPRQRWTWLQRRPALESLGLARRPRPGALVADDLPEHESARYLPRPTREDGWLLLYARLPFVDTPTQRSQGQNQYGAVGHRPLRHPADARGYRRWSAFLS